MPTSYTYDADRGIIHVHPQGDVLLSEVAARLKRVTEDESIPPGAAEFVHLDGVASFHYGSRESAGIPFLHRPMRIRKQLRATIYIAESDFHFGMARMLQTWFEVAGPDWTISVVRSEEEARRLLAGPTA